MNDTVSDVFEEVFFPETVPGIEVGSMPCCSLTMLPFPGLVDALAAVAATGCGTPAPPAPSPAHSRRRVDRAMLICSLGSAPSGAAVTARMAAVEHVVAGVHSALRGQWW